jgi:hypothetical protein
MERRALHEAGHAVVAHALGRTPTYATREREPTTSRRLPVGHPLNPFPHPFVSGGFHISEPLLAKEVTAQFASGQPLKPEHVEWVRQQAVIIIAGPIAEEKNSGPEWQADLNDLSHWAVVLGVVQSGEQVPPAFMHAVAKAAHTILADNTETLSTVMNALIARGDLGEAELAEALAGTPRGSHRHLLATVPGGGSGGDR